MKLTKLNFLIEFLFFGFVLQVGANPKSSNGNCFVKAGTNVPEKC